MVRYVIDTKIEEYQGEFVEFVLDYEDNKTIITLESDNAYLESILNMSGWSYIKETV